MPDMMPYLRLQNTYLSKIRFLAALVKVRPQSVAECILPLFQCLQERPQAVFPEPDVQSGPGAEESSLRSQRLQDMFL